MLIAGQMEKRMDDEENTWKSAMKNEKQPSSSSSKKEKGSGYTSLTTQEKWEWHADDYAFRIVILGESWEGLTSPCDPEHKWFNRGLIQQAVERKRAKLRARQDWNRKIEIEEAQRERWRRAARLRADAAGLPQPDRDVSGMSREEQAARGRELCEAWARKHGYIDFAAAERAGKGWGDVVRSFGGIKQMPRPQSSHYTAGDMGVKAAPAKIEIPEGQGEFLRAELAKRLGKATGEAAE